MNGTGEHTGQAAALGVGLAAGAVMLIVSQTPKALDWLDRKIHAYKSHHKDCYNAIRFAYQHTCYPSEKGTPLFTVTVHQESAAAGSNAVDQIFPVYFLYDPEEQKAGFYFPQLFKQGYRPVLDERIWHGHLNRKSEILTELQDLISYICEYQQLREGEFINLDIGKKLGNIGHMIKGAVNGESAFYYDPINMFCEEMKQWLYQASGVSLDDRLIEAIKVRSKYVNKLYLSDQFTQFNQLEPFKKFLAELRNSLGNLVPIIDDILSRRCVRDYLKDTKITTGGLIRSSCEFIFYINNRSVNMPSGFSMRQICLPTEKQLASYQQSTVSIRSRLLVKLISDSGIINIGSSTQVVERDRMEYQFSRGNELLYPLDRQDNDWNRDVTNWWELSEKKNNEGGEAAKQRLGIFEVFQTAQGATDYLTLLSETEKMVFFYVICDKLHDLAGEVGNLSVFGYAAKVVASSLEVFAKAMTSYKNALERFFHQADGIYSTSNNRDSHAKLEPHFDAWCRVAYPHISQSYSDITDHLTLVKKNIADLNAHIGKINDPKHAEKVQRQIKDILDLVSFFTKESPLTKEDEIQASPGTPGRAGNAAFFEPRAPLQPAIKAGSDSASTPIVPAKPIGWTRARVPLTGKTEIPVESVDPATASKRKSLTRTASFGKKLKELMRPEQVTDSSQGGKSMSRTPSSTRIRSFFSKDGSNSVMDSAGDSVDSPKFPIQKKRTVSSPAVVRPLPPEEELPVATSTPVVTPIANPQYITIDLTSDPKNASTSLEDTNCCHFIGKALQTNPQANDLQIQKNRITEEGVPALCALLQKHTPLRKLDVSGNKHLFSNPFAANKDWPPSAEAFSKLVGSHPSLKEFLASNCGLTKEGAIALSMGIGRSSLENLDLCDNKITDAGAIAICNASLQVVTLSSLRMAGNALTQNSCEAISNLVTQNKSLETLDLSDNVLGDDGAIMICRAAANQPKLSALMLRGNKLTDKFAVVFCTLLQENRHIVNFDVSDNFFSDKMATEIQALIRKNRSLIQDQVQLTRSRSTTTVGSLSPRMN